MTVSGAWSRYQRARPPSPHAWAVGSRCSPTRLTSTWPLASERLSPIISAEGTSEKGGRRNVVDRRRRKRSLEAAFL
jgi:hypothetical protein